MNYSVGVDLGNSHTKVYTNYEGKEIEYIVPSAVKNGYDSFSTVDCEKVIYDNTEYSVGIGDSLINKRKYFSDYYKIIFLTSIANTFKELNENSLKIDVAISMPVNLFKDKEFRENVKKHINSWGLQKIVVNDKEYLIEISNLDVWVEGGIHLLNMDRENNTKDIVYDIGGFTQDSIYVRYGKIIKGNTEKKGIIKLKEELYDLFRKDHKITDLDNDSKQELFNKIKENSTFKLNDIEISLEKYNKYLDGYVSNIFDSIEKMYEIDDKNIIFIGGGSVELEDLIKSYGDEYKIKFNKLGNFANAITNYFYAKNIMVV